MRSLILDQNCLRLPHQDLYSRRFKLSWIANNVIARVAQLVELHVANVVVAGSSPVSRSNKRG